MALKKKNVPAPTFAERLVTLKAEAADAVSVFDKIATDLETTADAKDSLGSEVYAEIERLEALVESYYSLMQDAEAEAHLLRNQANNVRALMGN